MNLSYPRFAKKKIKNLWILKLCDEQQCDEKNGYVTDMAIMAKNLTVVNSTQQVQGFRFFESYVPRGEGRAQKRPMWTNQKENKTNTS